MKVKGKTIMAILCAKHLPDDSAPAGGLGERADCRISGRKVRSEILNGTAWGKNEREEEEATSGPNEIATCEATPTGVRCWTERLIS